MNENATVEAPPALEYEEVIPLIRQALEQAEAPISLRQILESMPKAARPKEETARFALQKDISEGVVFQYPELRGKPQYWLHPQEEFARRKLMVAVARGSQRQSEIIAAVAGLAPLKGFAKSRLESLFRTLVNDGQIKKLPPYLGTKSDLYSAFSLQPGDYVKDVIRRLSEKLGVSESDLMGSYEPKIAFSADSKINQQPSEVESSFETLQGTSEESKSSSADLIVEAMLELNPRVKEGDMVGIPQLRTQLNLQLPDADFDAALLSASASGRVSIHLFDRPFLISPEERAQLVHDDAGNFYNTVSLRRE